MTKVYGYARVSTDSQTLDAQMHALVKAGVPYGQIEQDGGVSGAIPALERPGMHSLLSALRPGDTFVTFSLSRVGRNTLDVLQLLDLLTKKGVAFKSISEAFDSSTPMGRAMVSIMAVMNQLERDFAVERTKAGIAAARARGSRIGRQETPGRREAVADLVAEGRTITEIASLLSISYNSAKRMVAKVA